MCARKPPPPPLVTPAPVIVFQDPHLIFAHGGRADFKGEHATWYNMLSAKNTSVNILFQHDDFHNPYKLVHGSKMGALAMTVRTNQTGQLVTIGFNASSSGPTRALVHTTSGDQWITHKSGEFKLENLQLALREKKLGGIGRAPWHGMALTVTDGRWEVQAWSKPYPNAAANPGKALLNVGFNSMYDVDHDVVAPHGLIGQSYDGDGMAVDGAQDNYFNLTEVTTKAMAEGAIEGTAADYKMSSMHATDFKYSRFDAVAAKPRDVSKLAGSKKFKAGAAGAAGAVPDVE